MVTLQCDELGFTYIYPAHYIRQDVKQQMGQDLRLPTEADFPLTTPDSRIEFQKSTGKQKGPGLHGTPHQTSTKSYFPIKEKLLLRQASGSPLQSGTNFPEREIERSKVEYRNMLQRAVEVLRISREGLWEREILQQKEMLQIEVEIAERKEMLQQREILPREAERIKEAIKVKERELAERKEMLQREMSEIMEETVEQRAMLRKSEMLQEGEMMQQMEILPREAGG